MRGSGNLKRLVTAALLTAMTFVATFAIKIPTPAQGYVHAGDGLVLISGMLLGPLYGALAAGCGSMLADFLGGYVLWAPGTFLIKLLTAAVAGEVYRRTEAHGQHIVRGILMSGILGEAVMIAGYFLYDTGVLYLINKGTPEAGLVAALVQSGAEIPFNLMQGAAGVIIASLLMPVVGKLRRQQP